MKLLFIFLASLSLGFIPQKNISIKQIECTDQIILVGDTVEGKISGIITRFIFEFNHDYPDELYIDSRADLNLSHEFDSTEQYPATVRIKLGDEYCFVPYPGESPDIKLPNPSLYKVSTSHMIDCQSNIQDSLIHYIDTMRARRVRGVYIGTMDEFKAHHPVIANRLYKNNSLELKIVKRDTFEPVEHITVPVEY